MKYRMIRFGVLSAGVASAAKESGQMILGLRQSLGGTILAMASSIEAARESNEESLEAVHQIRQTSVEVAQRSEAICSFMVDMASVFETRTLSRQNLAASQDICSGIEQTAASMSGLAAAGQSFTAQVAQIGVALATIHDSLIDEHMADAA